MKTYLFTLFTILLPCMLALGTEYFVDPAAGNDASNSGTDELHPFKTTARGDEKLVPGDTLTLLDGTYPAMMVDKSGNKANWITIRARHARKAVVSLAVGWYDSASKCVDLSGVSYARVIGLSVVGCSVSSHAIVDAQDGININGCHHIVVQNCEIRDCSGGGIGGYDKYWTKEGMRNGPLDFITIEGNEVFGCAFWCKYLGSGISVCDAKDAGLGKDPSGYNIVIRNNICHGNENKIGEYTKQINNVATATDGNGIIIDYLTPNNHYPYNVLVEGNLCFDNGGRGIHVFKSANTTVQYNTCWHNNRNKLDYSGDHDQGEISSVFANNVQIHDNIAVSNTNSWSSALTVFSSTNVTISTNLLRGARCISNSSSVTERGTLNSDPLFVNPGAGPTADFHLRSGSPAIHAADGKPAPARDMDGVGRSQGPANDLGAYGYGQR